MNLCTISAGCINVPMIASALQSFETKARVWSWRAAAQLLGSSQQLRTDMVCLLYTAFHLQQSSQITSRRIRSKCTRDQLASDSVCLIVASIPTAVASLLRIAQSLSCSNRQLRTTVLSLNARLVSPYSANKITMQSKHQPSRCSSRHRFIKDDLCLQKHLGRPSAPLLFPGPLIPK